MAENGGEFDKVEAHVLAEMESLRREVRQVREDIAKLSTIDQQLDLAERVASLERVKWALPATAVLAIAIAFAGGLS